MSDADIQQLLKEAVDFDSMECRNNGLYYQVNESEPFSSWFNESEPYSGWAKVMYDSGQVKGLAQVKDGKKDGLMTAWHENGQKMAEVTYKDGNQDGLSTGWHENGQKQVESTYKDGEEVSAKFWNSKGEEVESLEESKD